MSDLKEGKLHGSKCRNRPNHHGGIETGNGRVNSSIFMRCRNRPNHHGGIETFWTSGHCKTQGYRSK